MPILFNIDEVMPGMVLAKAILSNDRILLNHNYKLSKTDIDLLKKRGVKTIYVSDPLLDKFCDDESQDIEVSQHVQEMIVSSIDNVEKTLKKHSSLENKDIYELQKSIQECVEYIKNNPVAVAIINQNSDNFMKQHATNVMYLSMLLALKTRSYIVNERIKSTSLRKNMECFDLNPMGLGAVLIDMHLSQYEVLANRTLKLDQVTEILNHPVSAYKELPDNIHPYSRLIVKTHHECWNGLGFPLGLKGQEVPVLSRIVRVADAFDLATSRNLFHNAKSHVYTLFHMSKGKYRNYFDANIVSALTSVIQPFPIGAKVKLSNNIYAVVAKHNPDLPFKPIVITAFDSEHKALPKQDLQKIDLSKVNGIKIINFMNEDISYIYNENIEIVKVEREKANNLFDVLFP